MLDEKTFPSDTCLTEVMCMLVVLQFCEQADDDRQVSQPHNSPQYIFFVVTVLQCIVHREVPSRCLGVVINDICLVTMHYLEIVFFQ